MASAVRGGIYTVCVVAVAICWAAWAYFGDFLAAFYLPSFLGLKLHMFLIGMVLSYGRTSHKKNILLELVWVLLLVSVPLETGHFQRPNILRYLVVIGIYVLVYAPRMPTWLGIKKASTTISGFLSSAVCSFMADMSYSVYLLHIFIVTPAALFVLHMLGGDGNAYIRFGICMVVSIPLTYVAAWIMHKVVERPGIECGRRLTKKLG